MERLDKGKTTIHNAYKYVKRQERCEEIKKKIEELPEGEYNVILADPPWEYEWSLTMTRKIENQYPTMTFEEIKNTDVPAADDAVLFLWATAPRLPQALEVMEAWGFEYVTNAAWDKGKIGMGYWFRGQHEHLLVGKKGDFSPPEQDKRVSSVVREERTKHSAKPGRVHEIIESYFPDAKCLELFARGEREGWTLWGPEAGLEPEDSDRQSAEVI
ncbi:hypothetical protein AKJ41_04485 [candidate division MSBL1 archaeon SCGC-AAA259O05]|uniref:Uncharacterized protein n=1 Tax=candidate division MSBL1 archaeon SCGC-AAA259O05 TaxID=1698271 RepID=A0A133V0S0_9EURY|nr:hypothetical protein AKJ41_04485 [candidate division MSBL1 archaeon SCGC-AAA259O05]